MFLYEKNLRDEFWEKYSKRSNIISYSFETGRPGGCDLLTFEENGGNYEINSFEFKLDDIKKAILQARFNLKFSHKAWICVPKEKEALIDERYRSEIKKYKGMGVITVSEGGFYNFFVKTFKQNDENLKLNQDIFKFIVTGLIK